MKIRAAVFEGVGKPLVIEDLELSDEPGPGEVVVRYRASGLCHSDLRRLSDPAQQPEVLGHEGAGVIEALGPGCDGLAVGDTVVASFRPFCGLCWHCVRGEGPHCTWGGGFAARSAGVPRHRRPDGTILNARLSTFGEAAILPRQYVVKVDTRLPFEQLALIGCGVTTGVGAAMNTAGVRPGSTVAVLGCGGVGQSAIQGAELAGASMIIAIDVVAAKLEFALAHGATHAVRAGEGMDPIAAVRDLTGGRGVDAALEVTGRPGNLRIAYDMTRQRGVVTAVGIGADCCDIPVRDIIMSEKQIRGSLYGSEPTPREFPKLVALAESGRLNLADMVSRVITLDEITEGFEAMERGELIRAVISYG